MPNSQWRTLSRLDADAIARLQTVWEERGAHQNHSISLVIADGSGNSTINSKFSAILQHPAYEVIARASHPVFRSVSLTVNEGRPFSLSISREPNSSFPGTDAINVSIGDGIAVEDVAKTIGAARGAFEPYGAVGAESLDVALGPVLGEFYRRREASVNQIEQALRELVAQSVDARRELDRRADVERQNLLAEIDAERLKTTAMLDARDNELREKDHALSAREATLDDRTNTHARREIHKELKAKFAERAESFSLTPETGAKRGVVQTAFWLLLLFTLAVATINIWEAVRLFDASTQPNWWLTTIASRGLISAFAFIAAVVYYIRWADSWSERHAAEEFKLKRLELDMDRASWLVEMALEWQEKKGSQIPPELVLQLSRNLFSVESDNARVQHPAEDIAAAVLGSASSLRIALPGGEATFDRKALRHISEPAKAKGD
ncbi:hypothetical protein [Gemmatimonas groenlandica]|uniref:Uncharacterized protein n=1 Tax=Gemmatimonas groenlandica TaxID=2732249 RepID=A0A6M4IPZ0_9BACT|nr:hypothetical protein [Gemmatimonas groenlandica]QJR36783.1 hypothetical protein HKW67_15290 [Gemmatimonas groenlandica]